MKQWKKSSRWRKARAAAYDRGNKRGWIRLQRLAAKPGKYTRYFDFSLLWEILHLPAFSSQAFSEPRPFPTDTGATTIRFIKAT